MKTKVAFIAFGEINTPYEKLEKEHDRALELLAWPDVEIMDGGLVIDDPAYETADKALATLSGQDFDVVIVCVCGWIPSHTVVRVTDKFRHLPMVLWGLSGWTENGRIITIAAQAGTTALRPAFEDLGYTFKYVYDVFGEEPSVETIRSYVNAAGAAARLRNSRVGTMGYRDMLLYGTQHDGVSLRGLLGVEVEPFEMLTMINVANDVDATEIKKETDTIIKDWCIDGAYDRQTLELGVRYALAVKQITLDRKFNALTLIDVDGMKKILNYPPAIIFMILGSQLDLPTVPENDILGNVSQLIAKEISGQIAPYVEFYEFFANSLLAGVPDYIPVESTNGPVKLMSTSFGLLAKSFLNVSKLKTGRVTCSRLFYRHGKYYMHVFGATAKEPPAWNEYGWTEPIPQLPSIELVLDGSVQEFADNVSGQHIILTYGDYLQEYIDFCRILDIEVV